MNLHSRRILALLIVAATLVVAFVWLDFWAGNSQGRGDSQLSTFSSRPVGTEATFSREPLRLYVAGEDTLSSALEKRLATLLGSGSTFRSVKLEGLPPSTAGDPGLMVEVSQRETFWTPVRATERLVVKITYSSNGDLSWRDDAVVRMENGGEPLRRIRGELHLEDSTNGLISLKGYDSYLGRYAAEQVSSVLSQAVENPS